MPRGDGTGPVGTGPMTGRGAGYCAGYSVPGFANPACGRGRGMGFGGGGYGHGWRHQFWATRLPGWMQQGPLPVGVGTQQAPLSADQERTVLKDQMKALQAQLSAIQDRLEALDAQRTNGS